ncbi:tRNA adenosine(34) deaminase TadA [Leptolyngbya sp. FACHB-711]|uniref:tRNA adenosine(34) deaminase TadA n=1 Tax=unclassified Leptolyngbya TaxID=2650499 RepID=UPI00168A16FD|nr:tRNA adenosine(34) deaminase TadA [Leptolyngbya sp. FACHB-711]MBD1848863.1 nucleoside deaminase [Cyanobacteria bacterium FACHB-502]MBD2025320.1 nucleoside deaminase [Leptolyngbya sp. FACHB-711]
MPLPPPPIDHPDYLIHYHWMTQAIELAQAAGEAGEIPVGAVIVQGNREIATGENRRERDRDPTAHAEILALRQAGQQLSSWHLESCTLYVTLEPCPMCAGAIVQARLGLLVYGADDPKTGAVRTVANLPDSACSFHRLPVVGGILELACRQQLQDWFRQRRRTHEQHRPANQPIDGEGTVP